MISIPHSFVFRCHLHGGNFLIKYTNLKISLELKRRNQHQPISPLHIIIKFKLSNSISHPPLGRYKILNNKTHPPTRESGDPVPVS